MEMSPSMLSAIIIVAASLVFIGLERIFPYNRGQKVFREGFWVDLVMYGLIQSWVLGVVITAIIGWFDGLLGPDRWLSVRSWPVPVQLAFFLVTHDLYIYWFHRWQHASMALWRVHEAHHSVRDVDWLAGVRSHALEILINQTIEFAPIVLLGAAPEVAVMKATVDAVWGMYIHSNLAIPLTWFSVVVNGPEMHRWHHARALAGNDANFGTKLGIWDRLFGTAYCPAERAADFGLADDPDYPTGYFGQQVAMFRAFKKVPA